MNKKKLTIAISVALIALLAIGGTLAWLTDKSGPVTNTFTAGDVDIKLTETDATGNETDGYAKTYKMVPGDILDKDPTVTVLAGSEPSWVFVKVEKINDVDAFLTYSIDTSVWTPLGDDYPGVYYKVEGATSTDTPYNVLVGNKVTVKPEVTKSQLDALTESNYPQLKFTAYAIQSANVATDVSGETEKAVKAWQELNKQ